MYNNLIKEYDGDFLKRIIAVHDLSGIGKCSLTAALPIISAAGIECNPVPTAVLSSHTGNISGYTFRDLTDDLIPYINHWKKIGIHPDAIYSGYLGSEKQVDAVETIIDEFADSNTHIIIDPAMADSGRLYSGFNSSFIKEMARLCKRADVITPNLTEAAFLTGAEYRHDYDTGYINSLIEALSDFTGRYIVLTGVSDRKGETGCAVSDKKTGEIKFFSSPECPGTYYGTGDIFASVLSACITSGKDCFTSAQNALEFTYKSIHETYLSGTDTRLGVAFEKFLPEIITYVKG